MGPLVIFRQFARGALLYFILLGFGSVSSRTFEIYSSKYSKSLEIFAIIAAPLSAVHSWRQKHPFRLQYNNTDRSVTDDTDNSFDYLRFASFHTSISFAVPRFYKKGLFLFINYTQFCIIYCSSCVNNFISCLDYSFKYGWCEQGDRANCCNGKQRVCTASGNRQVIFTNCLKLHS